jgi:hypothetical protein
MAGCLGGIGQTRRREAHDWPAWCALPLWLSERTVVGISHDAGVWLAAIRERQYREGSPWSETGISFHSLLKQILGIEQRAQSLKKGFLSERMPCADLPVT